MDGVNIKPLSDRVIIKPLEMDKKTAGGLLLPDTKEKPQEGIIINVGNGKKDEPMTVKIGDHVLFSKYGGTEYKVNNETYLIMRESDIYAIIEDK
jgi:chaperonin GroES